MRPVTNREKSVRKSPHGPLGGAVTPYVSWYSHVGVEREEKWEEETYLGLSLRPVWIYLYDSFTWMISVSSWPSLSLLHSVQRKIISRCIFHIGEREGTQGETDCSDRRKGEEEIYGNVLKIPSWYASDGEVRNLSVMWTGREETTVSSLYSVVHLNPTVVAVTFVLHGNYISLKPL